MQAASSGFGKTVYTGPCYGTDDSYFFGQNPQEGKFQIKGRAFVIFYRNLRFQIYDSHSLENNYLSNRINILEMARKC